MCDRQLIRTKSVGFELVDHLLTEGPAGDAQIVLRLQVHHVSGNTPKYVPSFR